MDIIDEDISLHEIAVLRTQYAKEKTIGNVSQNTQFAYAYNLCRSKDGECLELALKLFEDLRSRTYEKSSTRDYLFFTSIAYLKLKKYEEALEFADIILKREPGNHQIKELKNRIKKDQVRDGLVGAAVIGGAAATVGLIGLGVVAMGVALARRK